MFNNIQRIIAVMVVLALFVSAAAGAVVTQDVEIRGEVADGYIEYDYANFAGFWYDLDKDRSSETMTVNCSGVDNRTIDDGDLVYNCAPVPVLYKNDALNTEYGGYMLLGFMAEKFVCYDNRSDQLVKLLIEWDSSDKAVLAMDDPMELPDGYMLAAPEIDLQGDRVWLKLYKDGECVDDSIVEGGNTYTYEDEDDVLHFSAEIESVFRGTESNLVVVKYIFMRSDTILEIDGGDTFGVMEVTGTSGSITLENDETMTLDEDSEVEIMDGLYFKVADNDNLRYYLAKTIVLECPECPEMPECPECPEPEPCPEVAPVNAANGTVVESEVIVDAEPEDKPTAVPTKKTLPGFESVFAIAGLLAVAWIVLRQRE